MNYYEKEFNSVAENLLQEYPGSSSQEQHSLTKSAVHRPIWLAKLAGGLFPTAGHKTESMGRGLETRGVAST
jgi:hypothetical protein